MDAQGIGQRIREQVEGGDASPCESPEHQEHIENMMITYENYRAQEYKLSCYEISIAV